MEPFEEAVRGVPLPAAAFALNGYDRVRGWGRYWQPTPMHHLTGLRVTQVVRGSAVASLPVGPWMLHPDGVHDVGLLADTACGVALDTVLDRGMLVQPLHGSYRPLRQVGEGCRTLIGRASVVRSGRDWGYVEGVVEDDGGRTVAGVSWHMAIRPVDFPVPDSAPDLVTVDGPSYADPDPWRRPVPPATHETMEAFHRDGCVATFRAVAEGRLALPPLYALLGIRPVSAEPGSVSTDLTTSEWLRTVHPSHVSVGYLRAQSVSTGVAAVWTLLPTGAWPAILEYSSTLVDPSPADGRRLTARATARRLGDAVVQARVETWDGDRRVLLGEVTAQERQAPVAPRAARRRSLATVLFTDLVGSTAHAERLGDTRWRDLLERHHRSARSRIEEHRGREVKSTGDGFLATFEAPSAAVAAACAIRDDARRLGLEIRAGIHTGEVEAIGGDVAGLAVHLAARIQAAAEPGSVWVSDTVRLLATGVSVWFDARGTHALKGIEEPVRLWEAVDGSPGGGRAGDDRPPIGALDGR